MSAWGAPRRRGVMYSEYELERMSLMEIPEGVQAEIQRINAAELAPVQDPNAELEGFVPGTGLMWRRAISRENLGSYLAFDLEDDNLHAAWNYVSVYRWATNAEANFYGFEGDSLIVVSVMSNAELARHLS